MKPSLLTLLLLGVLFSLPGCAAKTERSEQFRYAVNEPLWPQFKAVSTADGIDATEADLLTRMYFVKYTGLCGDSFPVFRRRGDWIAETDAQENPIRIDARSGEIQQRGNPVSRPPWDDLRKLVEMMPGR